MIISGQNFANLADYKFAETIKDGNSTKDILYPLNMNILDDGDLIYCKTDYVLKMFEMMKNLTKKVNIITSQSDYEINKSLFERKPDCINKWFAININYEHNDLIPIPLGIANDYCPITAKFEHIEDNIEKKKLMYINHRIWTNPKEREYIYKLYDNNDWCSVDEPNLSIEQFKEKAKQHYYMICPRGNGIDTHRLWECLYMGTIPIVKNYITHKNLKDLPILFVEDYREINEKFLLDNLILLKDKKRDLLYINKWEKIIRGS